MDDFIDRFRWRYFGFVLWLLVTLSCAAVDCVTWGWMLDFIDRPVVFAEKPPLLGLLHVGVVIVATLGFFGLLVERRGAWFWTIVCILLAVFMPATGIIMVAATCVLTPIPDSSSYEDEAQGLYAFFRKKREIFLDRLEELDEDTPENEEEYDLLRQRWLDLEPYEDVLIGDDFSRKRDVLTTIAREPNAWSVKLLRRCLSDRNPDIRFYASGALGRIEEDMTTAITALQGELDTLPDSEDLKGQLITEYLDIIALKLVPAATERHYLETALTLVETLPHSRETLEQHALVLDGLGRHDQLLELLRWREHLPLPLLQIKCNTLLHSQRFDELAVACHEVLERQDVEDEALIKAARFWTNGSS